MKMRNTFNSYGLIAILFHWLMALLIIGLLILGLIMTQMPISHQKLTFYGWHKEFGILVLMLVALRFIWRLLNILPPMPEHVPPLQKLAAYLMHYVLYGFMIAMPVTGWMLSSAAGLSVSFFGLFVLPDLVGPSEHLRMLLSKGHEFLGYALILALIGHTGAALYHHFFYKDNVLRRMLP